MTGPRLVRFALAFTITCGLALLPSAAGAVTRTCGTDALNNTTTVLCASGPCTGTSVTFNANIDVTAGGCTFDLGGRALLVQKTFQMIGGSGFIKIINAGNITITATGKLKSRGDFIEPNGFIIGGGLITLASSGTIIDHGIIDVSGDSAGSIRLTAVGDVTLDTDSSIVGTGDTLADEGQRYADGGSLDVSSSAGGITLSGIINLVGNNQATGGAVSLLAARNVTISEVVDAAGGGSDGGQIDVVAGDNILVTKALDVSSQVGGGFGGTITLTSGIDSLGGIVPGGSVTVSNAMLRLTGSPAETSGGDGGELDVNAFGLVRFTGASVGIHADAATTFDGDGGAIFIASTDNSFFTLGPLDGNLELAGVVSARGGNDGGSGGVIELSAGRDLLVTATINASGRQSGGDISGDAGGAIRLDGAITAPATDSIGDGGGIDFAAGLASVASLTVAADVDAPGGSASGGHADISLAGCSVSVEPSVTIDGHAGVSINNVSGGSDVTLMSLAPTQIKTGARLLAYPGGHVYTTHPPGQNPVIASGVTFNPARIDRPSTTAPFPNCPLCGDGRHSLGEGCDDGNLINGDGCAANCTVEPGYTCGAGNPSPCTPTCGDGVIIAPEQCDDGDVASNDGCSSACVVEHGWACTGQPSVCEQACGDGVVTVNEECDDGNLVNGDGCDNNCRFTACGNGIVTAGESCDDGNLLNGDCCSALCQFESAGNPCAADSNGCTDDVCNGNGSCTHPNNSAPCADEGNACTNDVCSGGSCTHPPNTNPCNDGNACTQTDTCQNGSCIGVNPVVCTALDQCHLPGTCAPATGVCSNPTKANGMTCSDGDACTRTDTCQNGTCTGANPVVCTAQDQCHVVGTCNSSSGVCSNPNKSEGSPCLDNNNCTQNDTCVSGVCTGGPPVVCTPSDQCHAAGTCIPATGSCTNPGVTGISCDDGNVCTRQDVCTNGTCGGDPRICNDGILQSSCGELCDDGNLVNGDGCDTNCTPTACGNGIVTAGEGCDDGGLAAGDGCSASCAVESGWQCSGTPSHCSEVCGDGIQTPGEECEDGNVAPRDGCSPTCKLELCAATPATGCRLPAESLKASVQLKEKSTSDKDGLSWKWIKGAVTPKAAFGNPRFTTDYAVCLYDDQGGVPRLKMSLTVPHGGFCSGRACWRDLSTGFKYSNSAGIPNGKLKITLKEGLSAGTAKVIVAGKGGLLFRPTLPLAQSPRVRVQLRNSNGACWETDFSTHTASDALQFKAKGD
jgi:cysteine-rich repeat protein